MRKIGIYKTVAFLSMLALTTFGLNGVGQVFAQPPTGDGHADHDHGDPIKLMVGNEPLYECCNGCIRKVQQNPQAYLAKARQPNVISRSADGHPGRSH